MGIPLVSIGRLARLVDPRALELIILPTEKCNFRCTYCYEDFAVGRMKPVIVESVKELIRRRAGDLDTLCLSWFGGEPLLARDIVLDVSTFAAELARGYPGLSY
ncbi:MAG TPA: radical SAM protein, partial [Thermoanaerobaculia bacterium]|nr:radical SAM protein [Thermoanaerobaculia bacterium]